VTLASDGKGDQERQKQWSVGPGFCRGFRMPLSRPGRSSLARHARPEPGLELGTIALYLVPLPKQCFGSAMRITKLHS
jgi:hypothetical protein